MIEAKTAKKNRVTVFQFGTSHFVTNDGCKIIEIVRTLS